MDFTTWLSLVAICCLGAMSPGPSLAVVLRHTVNNGRWHGIVTAVTHACGVALWAVLTVSGLAVLISETPMVYKIITYLGAAYLAWIGYKSLTAKEVGAFEIGEAKASYWEASKDGAMISVLNPKMAIFFLALFSQFIQPGMGVRDQLIIVGTPAFIDAGYYVIVALLLSQSSILTKLQDKALWINRVCGVLFVGLALRVVTL